MLASRFAASLSCFAVATVAASISAAEATPVRTETPAHAAVALPAGDASGRPVTLILRAGDLDREALRDAIELELRRPVALKDEAATADSEEDSLSVAHRPETGELIVTWDSEGHTVTRVIEAAAEREQVIADAALLAGNLSREQVALAPRGELPSEARDVVPLAPAPSRTKPTAPWRWATAGVLYPFATHAGEPEVTSRLDFNLIYGRVGAVEGVQLGGVNVVARQSYAEPGVQGLQLAYVGNWVSGDTQGFQVATLLNYSSGRSRAWQASFVSNFAGHAWGLQSAFVFNSVKSLSGVQIALVNHGGDIDGVQLGLVNIADQVRGAAIGLINVADDVDGVPLAPISVTRSGGIHPTAWSGTKGWANAGVKFSTKSTYTLFYGSYHEAFDLELVGGGLLLGGRIPIAPQLFTDVDLGATYLIAPERTEEGTRKYNEQVLQPRVRAALAYRPFRHFGVFAGVSATGQIHAERGWDRLSASIGPEFFGGLEL